MIPRPRNSLIWRLVNACLAAEMLYCVFELLIFDMVFFHLSIFFLCCSPSKFITCVFSVGVILISASKFSIDNKQCCVEEAFSMTLV